MGLSSNPRSLPSKRCKTHALKRGIPASKVKSSKHQRNLNGELVCRVDQGTLKWTKCEKKRLGKGYHQPYHLTCSHSNYYNCVGPASSERTRAVEKSAKINIANNTRKLEARQKGGKENPIKRAHGATFFGLSRPPTSPATPPSTSDDKSNDKSEQASQANNDNTSLCPLSQADLVLSSYYSFLKYDRVC